MPLTPRLVTLVKCNGEASRIFIDVEELYTCCLRILRADKLKTCMNLKTGLHYVYDAQAGVANMALNTVIMQRVYGTLDNEPIAGDVLIIDNEIMEEHIRRKAPQ